MVMSAMLLTLQVTHFVFMHATRLMGRASSLLLIQIIKKQLLNEVKCAFTFLQIFTYPKLDNFDRISTTC